MSDDLIYKVFIELAVLEGKREVSGAWTISDPQEMSRLLARAFRMVQRASMPADERP